ncbi:MAG: hypothetical protein NPIRA06_16670 [Nitrospirales bacterium]|nr:MAG: hypothetical protein NPIRA06_16670 [Nitrospirales bacterium]
MSISHTGTHYPFHAFFQISLDGAQDKSPHFPSILNRPQFTPKASHAGILYPRGFHKEFPFNLPFPQSRLLKNLNLGALRDVQMNARARLETWLNWKEKNVIEK